MRFQVGELARLVVAIGDRSAAHLGQIVEIKELRVYSVRDGTPFDYGTIAVDDGVRMGCFDWQLQKLNPPEEPASLIKQEEVSA